MPATAGGDAQFVGLADFHDGCELVHRLGVNDRHGLQREPQVEGAARIRIPRVSGEERSYASGKGAELTELLAQIEGGPVGCVAQDQKGPQN